MTESEKRALYKRFEAERDYIPNGGQLSRNDQITEPRPATGIERCGVPTCHDPQSGPIYCGRLADWVSHVVGTKKFVAVCGRHKRNLDQMIRDRKPKPDTTPEPT